VIRTLDLGALRSFVAVAETGGVTRAAAFVSLTQSAVSMQIRRLEDALGQTLLDRAGRGVRLTAAGEQLLGYARRILALNDEVLARMTDRAFEGEIGLGVPSDIVYPALPQVLQQFAAAYPRMKVQLVSSYTRRLKALFARGEADVILTTEDSVDPGGETLTTLPLVWVGAPGGTAWCGRPLRLAFERNCIFRTGIEAALDRAGIAWEMAVESDSSRTIEASVSADLGVHAMIATTVPPHLERITHGGALPELDSTRINMYQGRPARSDAATALAQMVRQAFEGR
jgi:DNA-binding transcriptional LysR family regulator